MDKYNSVPVFVAQAEGVAAAQEFVKSIVDDIVVKVTSGISDFSLKEGVSDKDPHMQQLRMAGDQKSAVYYELVKNAQDHANGTNSQSAMTNIYGIIIANAEMLGVELSKAKSLKSKLNPKLRAA